MKIAPFKNRYGDTITFVETPDGKVEMSGYDPRWIRAGWDNDYSDAYEVYIKQCNSLKEPDYDYLIEDVNENRIRPMTYQEFANEVYINEKYKHYSKLVKTDKSRYVMVDPSGGPYIAVGFDIEEFFSDGKTRIVEEIEFQNEKIILTISNN